MASTSDKISRIRDAIEDINDFPKPGIMFKDIFPILRNPAVFGDLIDVLTDCARELNCDALVGLEARGFLFGPTVALNLGIPFVPFRKKGKLPGRVASVSYQLEYGTDTLECQVDALKEGQRIIILDDVLATGGTLAAACQLAEKVKAKVIECLVIITLQELNGKERVPAKVHSILDLS